jgi:3-oxoacyl-[acyl-carrier protein] reductase
MAQRVTPWRFLVFGASGAIGAAVSERGARAEWEVVGAARSEQRPFPGAPVHSWAIYDPFGAGGLPATLMEGGAFDAVCWAQGANLADSIRTFEASAHLDLYRSNCLYVLQSLHDLLAAGLLSEEGARLCVVSSIWQTLARQNKLSYVVTKAAVGGLVRSAAVDLAAEGHLVNAVLPGVLDTPMTAANLSAAQLASVKSATLFNALPSLDSVAELVGFLCSPANTSITGQSMAVDHGFSHARLL